jgi:hypothetical protein
MFSCDIARAASLMRRKRAGYCPGPLAHPTIFSASAYAQVFCAAWTASLVSCFRK